MTLEDRIEELADVQRETNDLLRTLLAHAEGDRETLDRLKREKGIMDALAPGTALYGDCGWMFDRYSDYDLRDYRPVTIVRVEGNAPSFKLIAADVDGDEYEADDLDWDCLEKFIKHTDPAIEKPEVEEKPAPTGPRYHGTRPRRRPPTTAERVQAGWEAL